MKLGRYKHYKGNYYEVIGIALNTETNEKMVLYRALYNCYDLKKEFGEDPLFVRPYGMFIEEITIDGKKCKRFKFCAKWEKLICENNIYWFLELL